MTSVCLNVICLYSGRLIVCPCIPPIECMLVACLCAVDTPSEGEGDFVEDFVGEEQGQPEPTGKPPLALASFYPILYAYALVYKLHYSVGIGVASGTPTLLRYYHP